MGEAPSEGTGVLKVGFSSLREHHEHAASLSAIFDSEELRTSQHTFPRSNYRVKGGARIRGKSARLESGLRGKRGRGSGFTDFGQLVPLSVGKWGPDRRVVAKGEGPLRCAIFRRATCPEQCRGRNARPPVVRTRDSGGRSFLVKSQVILYTFFKFKGVRIQPG